METVSRQNSVSFLHKSLVNLSITYELDTRSRDLNIDFILGYYLLGAVKLTKNADSDKYRYNCYSVGFDARSQWCYF